jgi:hypothetical protein
MSLTTKAIPVEAVAANWQILMELEDAPDLGHFCWKLNPNEQSS